MLKETQVNKLRRNVAQTPENLPELFSALADKTRYRMFHLLLENKDLCVTDIAKVMKISVPAASQQFKILEQAGLVQRERKGQMACYCIDDQSAAVKSITKLMGK